jgi:methylaspartate ammonia-lyase
VKKLKLDLEKLDVNSYEVETNTQQSRGTVHGAETTSRYCNTTQLEYYLGGTWMQDP